MADTEMTDTEKKPDLYVVDYSAKSIAVFGPETKKWSGNLKGMGGVFNHSLKQVVEGKEVVMAGWIFKVGKTDEVVTFVEEANRGIIDVIPNEPKPRAAPAKGGAKNPPQSDTIAFTYTVQKPNELAIVLFEDGTQEEYDTSYILNDKVYLVKADGSRLPLCVVSGQWVVLPYWNRRHDVLFKSA
jgi:hypothetical protein